MLREKKLNDYKIKHTKNSNLQTVKKSKNLSNKQQYHCNYMTVYFVIKYTMVIKNKQFKNNAI